MLPAVSKGFFRRFLPPEPHGAGSYCASGRPSSTPFLVGTRTPFLMWRVRDTSSEQDSAPPGMYHIETLPSTGSSRPEVSRRRMKPEGDTRTQEPSESRRTVRASGRAAILSHAPAARLPVPLPQIPSRYGPRPTPGAVHRASQESRGARGMRGRANLTDRACAPYR